ncbi:MAG: tRNA (N6-threonylcarbamoyladenosine(37)-N6)-methyltransferase TrmO [Candidatus Kapaibacterium sp.]|nr:MAG: tRNA (N6-threonylcarbamoyladenosine(37)-N6)-methyltransferase TrmO [Candidatus Kapabacteria bacterium]
MQPSSSTQQPHIAHSYTVEPIAFVRTEFRRKYDAPRQPAPEHSIQGDKEQGDKEQQQNEQQHGVVEFLRHRNFEQALADLQGMERVWLVYIFHHNLSHWKPKVLPPRGRTKRGVFATRAPYRPNPIGLSLVKIKEIRGLQMFIGNCDVLDGTPILDVKPYLPEYDSFPDSATGWWGKERTKEQEYMIEMSAQASEQCTFLLGHGISAVEKMCAVLRRDPHPHPYQRVKVLGEIDGETYYEIARQDWRLRYCIREERVLVRECRSGFFPEAIPPNAAVHQAFWERWTDNDGRVHTTVW